MNTHVIRNATLFLTFHVKERVKLCLESFCLVYLSFIFNCKFIFLL